MEMELKQTPRHTQATAPSFITAPCVVAAAWPITCTTASPPLHQRTTLPQRITASNQRFEECLDHSEGIYLVCLLTERHHGVC
ncbi:hypothetical protein D1605_008065 [Xylella fastidiosa subsp. fastidiosa]|uniref:Uncharacterized protein n=3 Tax=Xylella fastidiosa TaxID=2371 RepID=Q87BE8_XYLFT|nr:hypothetical protein [Xylella fastidiosa]AAO29351.1 conserved hypothetical protein [Xylella fastidiosa Temecula1]EGO82143.1 hypothetical protein XFEB_00885 [Xylella fastidiosa EB92.1]MBE0262258.1 hypothetical protein [Xylella fastidiosa subsp. fastidiosa]MBE0270977.1 hypothetical protein [Xylella fastidiosa subsp. fastidiosa]MBE0279832.1 hypothetical protein [Xylella fastidiosa subsp. fastidiosa]